MIQKLRDTYSHTPQEIKDKLNELIDRHNELKRDFDSRNPLVRVISVTNLISWCGGFINEEELKNSIFLARKAE